MHFKASLFLKKKLDSRLDIPKSQIANLPMGPMEYAVTGNGAPILLIHGGVGGFDLSLLLFQSYIPDGYQLISPSRPGYLRSPLSTGKTPFEQATALVQLLDYLEIEQALVVCLSSGGMSAYEMAIHYPNRVKGIIAVNAIAGPYTIPPHMGEMMPVMSFGAPGLWLTKEAIIYFPKTVLKAVLESQGDLESDILEHRTNEILESPLCLEAFASLVHTTLSYGKREIGTENDVEQGANIDWYNFHQITCPALVIHGTHDKNVKFLHGVFAYEGLGSEYKDRVWIENGTHLAFFFDDIHGISAAKFKDFIIQFA